MKKVNALIIGSVEISKDLFHEINNLKEINTVGIITKNKSTVNSDFYSLNEEAKKISIKPLISNGRDYEKIIKYSKVCKAEICFCIGWSHILPKKFLDIFKYGVIGFHPTKIPYNKGRHPIIWTIFLGLSETATSFFLMNSRADEGEILSQKKIKVLRKDDAGSLYKKISIQACKQIKSFVPNFINGSLKSKSQNKKTGNIWRKRTFEDGLIDWRMSFKAIECLVKALSSPYPGASCIYNGKYYKVFKVSKGKKISKNIEPGKVLDVSKEKIIVKCWDYSVNILKHNFSKKPKKGEYLC